MHKTHLKNQHDITLSSVPVTSPQVLLLQKRAMSLDWRFKVNNLGIINDQKVRGEVYSVLYNKNHV